MKALSIMQPWAAAIAIGEKPVENRKWSTTYRGPLLIHASKTMDSDWFDEEMFLARTFRQRYGAVLRALHRRDDFPVGGIIGICTLTDIVRTSESVWFIGPYGWCLTDAYPLPFLPCKGHLGVFDVPEEIAGAVTLLLEERYASKSD